MPFATRIGGLGVRGRIDAVFADPDGGVTVIDWKTGRPPPPAHRAAASVQLACYRLAVSELRAIPLERVRAAFYYVATGDTVAPADVLDADGICDLIAEATSNAAPHREQPIGDDDSSASPSTEPSLRTARRFVPWRR